MNEDKWVKLRNVMPINCFFLRYEKTEQWRKNDKKCFALADKHEIEEEEDDETNKKCDELKMKKRKGV